MIRTIGGTNGAFGEKWIMEIKFNLSMSCADPEIFMRGSNENGNFWSQTRGGGGPTPKISRNYLILGKIFKFQGVGGLMI